MINNTLLSRVILCLLVIGGLQLPLSEALANSSRTVEYFKQEGDEAIERALSADHPQKYLKQAIESYRRGLDLEEDNSYFLNELSRLYMALAEAFASDRDSKLEAYQKGFEFGLESMRTCSEFDERYRNQGKKAFTDLPDSLTDLRAIYWTAANYGRLAEYSGVKKSLGDLPKLLAMNERVLELDEEYLGGAAHRSLAAIQASVLDKTPWSMTEVLKYDLSWTKVRTHLRQATELAPDCLANYYTYAKYYSLKRGDKQAAKKHLLKVFREPIGEDYPFLNLFAKWDTIELWKEKWGELPEDFSDDHPQVP